MFEKIISSLLPQRLPVVGQGIHFGQEHNETQEVTVDENKELNEGMEYYFGCSSLKELNRAAMKSGIGAQYLLKIAGGENMDE